MRGGCPNYIHSYAIDAGCFVETETIQHPGYAPYVAAKKLWFNPNDGHILDDERPEGTVYHWLLPDPGMASYDDKVIKPKAEKRAAKLQARAYGKTGFGPWDLRAPAPVIEPGAAMPKIPFAVAPTSLSFVKSSMRMGPPMPQTIVQNFAPF